MARSAEQIVAKAEAERQQGRAWRAREILAGAIAGGRVEPAILEAYGRLLDTLGDRVEAGKYLFLCGARPQEYEAPIALFKRRHGKSGYRYLLSQLPAAVRRLEFGELPAAVRDDLREMGLSPESRGRGARWTTPGGTAASGRIREAAVLGVLFLLLFALALGFWTIGSCVWRAFVPDQL